MLRSVARFTLIAGLCAGLAAPMPSVPPDPDRDSTGPLVYAPAIAGAVTVFPVLWRSAAPHAQAAGTRSYLGTLSVASFMLERTSGDDAIGDYRGVAMARLTGAPAQGALYRLVDVATGAQDTTPLDVTVRSTWPATVTDVDDVRLTDGRLRLHVKVDGAVAQVWAVPSSVTQVYSTWAAYRALSGSATVSGGEADIELQAATGAKLVVYATGTDGAPVSVGVVYVVTQ